MSQCNQFRHNPLIHRLSADHIQLPSLTEVRWGWVRVTNVALLNFPPPQRDEILLFVTPNSGWGTGILKVMRPWHLRGADQDCVFHAWNMLGWRSKQWKKTNSLFPRYSLIKLGFIIDQNLPPERPLLLTQCVYLPWSHLNYFACLAWHWQTVFGELEKIWIVNKQISEH